MVNKLKIRSINFLKDLHAFGLFVAMTNLLWPCIVSLPSDFGNPLMNLKHKIVLEKIKSDFGDIISRKQENRENETTTKKIIWFCWLQGWKNMPNTVRECHRSIEKNNPDVILNFIDFYNVKDYISLPGHIIDSFKKGFIGSAHLTDIIRTFLLAEHGGMWIDATIYNTDKIPDSLFEMPFFSINRINDGFYVSENKWSNFLLSSNGDCYLFPLVKQLFIAYTLKYDRFVDYFLMDYFIKVSYDTHSKIREDIDMVQLNNPHCHDLVKILDREFDRGKLNELRSDTMFFKLSWRGHYQDEVNQVPTNWSMLTSEFSDV